MKNIYRKSVLVGLLVFFLSGISWAEEGQDVHELDKIIITATRTEASQDSTGSSATVITADEINQTNNDDLSEVLRDVPGVTVSHSGSFGGLTDVYLRGTKPGHTLVMVDGVELNDPTSPDRSFDFSHLTKDNIERVEVIRGPQSTLYGSDALAGVINVITKKGEGKPKFSTFFEGGSHQTFREGLGLSGSSKDVDYSFFLSRWDTAGISMAKDGTEKDKANNSSLSSRIGYKITEQSKLNFVLRRTYSKTSLDDGAFLDDPNYTSWYQDLVAKMELVQEFTPWWDSKFAYSYFGITRKYRDGIDNVDTVDSQSWYKGNTQKYEWQNNFSPVKWNIITAGFEYAEERGGSYYRSGIADPSLLNRTKVGNKAYYLQNQFNFMEHLFITPGLRIDDHELFGTKTTYKVSAAYLHPTHTRLKANWATGFKAPSIYQLFSTEDYGGGPIGDRNLKPDISKSYDFGFEQGLLNDKLSFGLTYFNNKVKDMVDYDLTANKYQNIGRIKTNGLEFSSSLKPINNLNIGASYTYLRTKDLDTGLQLVRRPRNQVELHVDWSFLENADVNLKTSYVGYKWDDAANSQKIKPYAKIDLSLSYRFNKNLKVFSRVENLLDRHYQEVLGYSTEGRSVYAGIKGEF